MPRKDESILHLLVECSWWVSVLVPGLQNFQTPDEYRNWGQLSGPDR